jgi:hypothetical protein
MTDKPREQYVPLNTKIAFGKSSERLLKKFGRDGLLTWMLFLAAAKRPPEQGVFTYTSEVEGWQLIGLNYPHTPAFSLDAFFGFTGRGGGTRLARHGSTRRVEVVNWSTWNDEWKKQQAAERMKELRLAEGHVEVVPRSSLGHVEVPSTSPLGLDEVALRSLENPRKTGTSPRTEAHAMSTEVEAESEGEKRQKQELPFEKDQEIERMLSLPGAGDGSRSVLRRYVMALPLSVSADVRQRASEDRKGVGWVVNALKGELEARGVAA